MGAIASITVPDAATTPVNHTFVPQRVEGNTARYQEKSNALPLGYWPYSSTLREPTNGGDVYRFSLDLAIPTLRTYVDGSGNSVTDVDYTHRYQITALLPNRGTLQNRKDIRKILVGILNDAATIDQLENLNNVY